MRRVRCCHRIAARAVWLRGRHTGRIVSAGSARPGRIRSAGPGGRSEWVAGHWRWNGSRYVWIPGRYVVRPVAYTHWVPEHWANRGGAWVWVPGHWA